jgi:hypothetical protein
MPVMSDLGAFNEFAQRLSCCKIAGRRGFADWKRTASSGIMAARRKSGAHLHRPWRANTTAPKASIPLIATERSLTQEVFPNSEKADLRGGAGSEPVRGHPRSFTSVSGVRRCCRPDVNFGYRL